MPDTYPLVRLNFGGATRYRRFPFLPRVGDRISITDQEDSVQYALDVVGVWFDDNYGDDHIEVVVQCDVAGQTSVATDH